MLVATLIGCLSLAACTSTAPSPGKVAEPNRLYEFSDFAAKAPAGQDWYVVQSLPSDPIHRVVFHKKLAISQFPATHSFYVLIQSQTVTNTFASPTDFQTFACHWLSQENPQRHKLLEAQCNLDPRFGDYCVRYHNKTLDFGAHVEGTVLTMESAGYLFRQPHVTDRLVLITYSERGRTNEMDSSLMSAGEEFIPRIEIK